jgi:hypothetical protein
MEFLGNHQQDCPSTKRLSCSIMPVVFVWGNTPINNQLLELRGMQFEWLLFAV